MEFITKAAMNISFISGYLDALMNIDTELYVTAKNTLLNNQILLQDSKVC